MRTLSEIVASDRQRQNTNQKLQVTDNRNQKHQSVEDRDFNRETARNRKELLVYQIQEPETPVR
jgi:hypothetical protein